MEEVERRRNPKTSLLEIEQNLLPIDIASALAVFYR